MNILDYMNHFELGYYVSATLASIAAIVSLIFAVKTISNLNHTLQLNKQFLELHKQQLEINTLALQENNRPYIIIYPCKPWKLCITNTGNRDAQYIIVKFELIKGELNEYFNEFPGMISVLNPSQKFEVPLVEMDLDMKFFVYKVKLIYTDTNDNMYESETIVDSNTVSFSNYF